jgi:hypothetical protein
VPAAAPVLAPVVDAACVLPALGDCIGVGGELGLGEATGFWWNRRLFWRGTHLIMLIF